MAANSEIKCNSSCRAGKQAVFSEKRMSLALRHQLAFNPPTGEDLRNVFYSEYWREESQQCEFGLKNIIPLTEILNHPEEQVCTSSNNHKIPF